MTDALLILILREYKSAWPDHKQKMEESLSSGKHRI